MGLYKSFNSLSAITEKDSYLCVAVCKTKYNTFKNEELLKQVERTVGIIMLIRQR